MTPMPKDVLFVIGAGAGGGVVSWAFTLMTGGTFGISSIAALPLCTILGIAAALVAVYVITPTDVTKTGKLIGFAVFCGFLWKPVLDAARVVLNEHIQVAQTTSEVKKQVSELRSASAPAATASAEIGAKAQDTATEVAELLRSSETLNNVKVDEAAKSQAAEAVSAIVQTSTANPVAATLALEEIRLAAEQTNKPEVAKLARESMRRVERVTPAPAEPMTTTQPPPF